VRMQCVNSLGIAKSRPIPFRIRILPATMLTNSFLLSYVF
jgi:hypothetical protein